MIKPTDNPNTQNWFDLSREDFMSNWYKHEYESNSYGGATGIAQKLMHQSLEKSYSKETNFDRVLEIGGNAGEHLSYVKHQYAEYILSDLHDVLTDTQKAQLRTINITFVQADALALPWHDETFDRVLNTCVIHHVSDPELALSEIRRVLRPGGTADIFLTSDPGMAFRLARRVGPLRSANRRGLGDVKRLVAARDHRNHIGGLRVLLKHVFRNDTFTESTYPIPRMPWNLTLFHTFRVMKSY